MTHISSEGDLCDDLQLDPWRILLTSLGALQMPT